MKRLTAHVSGKIQGAGYRARVIDMARAFSLRGTIQNLNDGEVKVIADADIKTLGNKMDDVRHDEKIVRILAITTIEQAHKMYGHLGGIFD